MMGDDGTPTMTDINALLTPAQVEDLCKLMYLSSPDSDYTKERLRKAAREIEEFARINQGTAWFARVAEALSDDHFTWKQPRYGRDTIDAVNAQINTAIEEARKDHLEHWQDNPKGFQEYYPYLTIGPDGPIEHPWTDKTVKLVKAWQAITIYDIWKVEYLVRQAASDALEESLLSMSIDEDNGSSIAEASKREFDKIIKGLEKSLAT